MFFYTSLIYYSDGENQVILKMFNHAIYHSLGASICKVNIAYSITLFVLNI